MRLGTTHIVGSVPAKHLLLLFILVKVWRVPRPLVVASWHEETVVVGFRLWKKRLVALWA
jgi:hypothetical protein